MQIWDSETDPINDVTEDPCFVKIDEENGVLRINDNDANYQRYTTCGFIGPSEKANAEKWGAFVVATEATSEENQGGEGPTLYANTDTVEMLKACFDIQD